MWKKIVHAGRPKNTEIIWIILTVLYRAVKPNTVNYLKQFKPVFGTVPCRYGSGSMHLI